MLKLSGPVLTLHLKLSKGGALCIIVQLATGKMIIFIDSKMLLLTPITAMLEKEFWKLICPNLCNYEQHLYYNEEQSGFH